MYTAFHALPVTARVWIYQADSLFNDSQKLVIENRVKSFLEQWDSHGAPLSGSFDLPYNHFIVIAVSEETASASGCSIDKSVRVIDQIQQETGLNLLDRSKVAYLEDKQIKLINISEVGKKVASGEIQSSTLIFNNSITTIADFKANWLIKAEDSWMKRHFKNLIVK